MEYSTMNALSTILPAGIKRSASKAITAFDAAYFAEGGLAELT